jgi:hypothetical protein
VRSLKVPASKETQRAGPTNNCDTTLKQQTGMKSCKNLQLPVESQVHGELGKHPDNVE